MESNMNRYQIQRIIRELVDEELDEVSTTAAEPGYSTPYAFAGNKETNKKKRKEVAQQSGMSVVDKDPDPEAGKLTEGRYSDWRNNESLTARQKIGRAIREVNQKLTEIEEMVQMNKRLKVEAGVQPTHYWKRTNKALYKMEAKLNRISSTLRDMRS